MKLGLLVLLAFAALAQDRASITGKVTDSAGKPVEHATVMVYEAGVKKGYGVFCPTCWVDCGKRTATDDAGSFRIAGLNPELWFTLLVVREGYSASYIHKVDPAHGPAETAVLAARPPIPDSSQVVRGKVVDQHGLPVPDAVVEQQGATFKDGAIFGPRGWIDQFAVTNDKGEFEIAYSKPAVQMILQVRPRAMAPKLFTVTTGGGRKTLTVTEGAVVRGRLMHDGKPVADAAVGLATHFRGSGTMFQEVQVGTRQDGTFTITNVPAGRIWMVYPKMESLASRGIGANPAPLETKDDGQEIDLGDIQLAKAYTLQGQVMLGDGKPVPPDMRILLSADRAWDSQSAVLSADGRFEFYGLPPGVYSLTPGVNGYQVPDVHSKVIEVLVTRDTRDLTIRMEPKVSEPRP